MTKELRNDRMDVERWKAACKAGSCQANYRRERGLTEARDDYFVDGVQWADEHPAQTQWRTVDEWPKDKEWILMMLDNGRLQATQWDDDGKGFNSGYAELNFSGWAMMRLPVEYKVVAWRPLADVANEYACHGTLAKQPEQPNQTTDGYELMQRRVVDLPLSVRTVNILKSADIETVADMARIKKTDYLKLRNFGKRSLGEIEDFFDRYGLHFGMDV